jgi:ATP-dependent Clp protease ATP-binding subunit ClpA
MFERFTNAARRVVFFARYEASQFGSRYIETHHLLLALLREHADLVEPWLDAGALKEIRDDFVRRFPPQVDLPTSVDLPLSHECRRVLAYGAEESQRMGSKHIDPGHLLLGVLREEQSEAAATLRQHGVLLAELRQRLIGFKGRFNQEDLYALVQKIPPKRADAAARILEALQWDVVKFSVASPRGTFEISFGGEGG